MASTALPGAQPGSRRRRKRLSPRSRHSIFVGVLKILLPATAVGLILLLVVWSQLSEENRFHISLTELAPDDIDSVNVVNARYEGLDERNRPFTVTAAHATQVDKVADVLDLKEPKADITTESGAWVAIEALTGRYGRKADLLDLKGSVTIFHDEGYEFHANTLRINLEDSTAVSYEPVDGQGPNGLLTAQGIEVTRGGDRIFFTGRSKMLLYPQSGDVAPPVPGDIAE
jgi:lipopolysaccharide export system protein LptC